MLKVLDGVPKALGLHPVLKIRLVFMKNDFFFFLRLGCISDFPATHDIQCFCLFQRG
jgi:hypothetical protein